MQERLDAAFLFGSLGNLNGALGAGWSVEDNFAWAVGDESRLTLPLPGGSARYRLRLTVQPLLHPGLRETQRLAVETDAGPLASFSVDRRTTIELALPLEQTAGRREIALLLRHPDALRPSDFKQINDSRLLALCFMSGALKREVDDASIAASAETQECHLIIAGSHPAGQIAEIVSLLPSLRQRLVCHWVATDQGNAARIPDAAALRGSTICWEQTGSDETVLSELHRRLPGGCEPRKFPAPRMQALWPFLGADPRLVAEPGLYPGGRYPFSDRVAPRLAWLQLPDDVLMLAYESMVEKEMPDLDAHLAADADVWRRQDASHDVKIADFILDNFRRHRLFFAPPHPTGLLLRHMILQLLACSPIEALCPPETLRHELDFLLTGYLGRRMELPVHPHVGRHFGLAWWQPDMHYRWYANHWTYQDYLVRYLRWMPWQP